MRFLHHGFKGHCCRRHVQMCGSSHCLKLQASSLDVQWATEVHWDSFFFPQSFKSFFKLQVFTSSHFWRKCHHLSRLWKLTCDRTSAITDVTGEEVHLVLSVTLPTTVSGLSLLRSSLVSVWRLHFIIRCLPPICNTAVAVYIRVLERLRIRLPQIHPSSSFRGKSSALLCSLWCCLVFVFPACPRVCVCVCVLSVFQNGVLPV